jgi:Adenylate kinase
MRHLVTLLSLSLLCASTLAFLPGKSPAWGVTMGSPSTTLSQSTDDNFDGVDLKRLLGVKQLKRMKRKREATSTQKPITKKPVQGGYSKSNKKSPARIIIAGAPASGKGTQCELIKEKFNVVHLSTGDMLRAAVAAGTPVGKQAKEYMDSGRLVPDEVIIGVVSGTCVCVCVCVYAGCIPDGWMNEMCW